MKTFEIFISSPCDVNDERRRAQRVIRKLQSEYGRFVKLEPVFWEHHPQSAALHFQEQIQRLPSETDLFVCILWSRLGTQLPMDKFQRPDGSMYQSGTEFEFEEALQGYRRNGSPDLWVYRKTDKEIFRCARSKLDVLERIEQQQLINQFLEHWFGSPQHVFKAGFNEFPTPSQFERLFEAHLREKLQQIIPGLIAEQAEILPWAREESPYRGLESFEYEHADIFFGRQTAIHSVLEQWQRQAEAGRAFILILGPSGSGKSSLVRAGVLPALEKEEFQGIECWRRAVLRPGESTEGSLAVLAESILSEGALPELMDLGYDDNKKLTHLWEQAADGLAAPLPKALELAAETEAKRERVNYRPRVCLVIVVDQLEELFNSNFQEDKRARFIKVIDHLARINNVWVIATLRNEFYDRLTQNDILSELKAGDGQYDLRSPSIVELGQIIRWPSRAAGLKFETDAQGQSLDDLLQETAGAYPDTLPLLEFCLDRLYRLAHSRGENILRHRDYLDMGGLEGSVAFQAEEVIRDFDSTKMAALRGLLRSLVTMHGNTALRRRAPVAQLEEIPGGHQVLQTLSNPRWRLITTDVDRTSGVAVAELVHEALLKSWKRLAAWINEDAELLRVRERMEELAGNWLVSNMDHGYLLQPGKQELDAKALLKHSWIQVDANTGVFLSLSLRKIRRIRKIQMLSVVGTFMIFIIFAGVFSWINYLERQRAESLAALAIKAVDRLTYELPNKLRNIAGTHEILRETFDKNAILLQRIETLRGETRLTAREKASNINKYGDQRLIFGDESGALRYYQESHGIFKRLATLEPDNAVRQRDLSVSYNKIGDVLFNQGKLEEALSNYKNSLSIREKLVTKNPANDQWQRDLSVAYEKVGKVLTDLNKINETYVFYKKALAIRKQLIKNAPINENRKYDLGIIEERVGTVLHNQGKFDEALGHFKVKRDIASKLVALNPLNIEWQRDLSVAYEKIGDVLMDQGNSDSALTNYRHTLSIRKMLVEIDKIKFQWQQDLSIIHGKIGEVLLFKGDYDDALIEYTEALASAQAFSKKNKDSSQVDWHRILVEWHVRLAQLAEQRGEYAMALEQYEDAKIISENLVKLRKDDSTLQQELDYILTQIATNHGQLAFSNILKGRYQKALSEAIKGLEIDPEQYWIKTNMVYVYLLTSELKKAKEICIENRNRLLNGNKNFSGWVLNDLKKLRGKGIDHPNFHYIEKWLKNETVDKTKS